ncbi:unnamed protein product [Rotaria magnacalcarata]|nr:unnamed protein product [Rotaria magnacalcarata]
MYTQNGTDGWENQINKIEERCDFTSLLKQEQKNKVVLNQYNHVKQQNSSTLLIKDNLYKNLKMVCRQHCLNLNSILQFSWHKILNIYGNSQHTVIGTIVPNIGTFPSIVDHDMDSLIIDAIKHIQDRMNEMIRQSTVDFSLPMKERVTHNLFDWLFAYKDNSILQSEIEGKEKSIDYETKYTVEKFDYPLVVIAYESVETECITIVQKYPGELFESQTIDNILGVANEILSQIVDNPVSQISDLHLSPKKQLQMIEEWNDTATDFPELNTTTTLHELFEEQVEKSSDKIAVVYENVQLTYRELNESANQLARYLRSICYIHPDDLIALLLDKSELMIISILSVWKSGAAYIPIDPSYPDERIQFILQDTKAKVIITNKKYLTRLESYSMIKIDVDSIRSIINGHNKTNMSPMCSCTNLAYIIYTSGTTGKPKSVLVEHKSVISFRNDVIRRYFSTDHNENSPQAILFFSSYVFDMSIEQIALSILNSNKLIILSNGFTIDEHFYDYLNENQVTYFSLTPSQLQQVDLRNLEHLKSLLVIGEPLTEIAFKNIRKQYSGKLINAYGITETTVYNTVSIYENDMKYKNSIGSPLSNTKGFVLNKNLNMLPVHAIGELYLTGDCISRGYLNRPELTAERFLPNPFQTEEEKKEGKNARIYKTGDLVRWLPDGELEYLGRNDLQVKIRGLRIELGEIESVLSSYQGVARSIVLAKEHKKKNIDTEATKYLVGYYVSDDDIDESVIKQYMQKKLPDYMIPNRLIRMEKVPVTINGKLDTKALLELDFSLDETNYCAPRNELEVKLCTIWSDILGIENIGIKDDFFRMGGDSVSSVQLVGRIEKDMNLHVSIKDIFSFRTIDSLCHNVCLKSFIPKVMKLCSTARSEQGILTGEVPLLPIQEWFFAKCSIGMNHWNQAFLIETPDLDESKLNDCLMALIDYHDAFKLRFKRLGVRKYCQYYDDSLNSRSLLPFNHLNVRSLEQSPNSKKLLDDILTKWQSQFDIENGPLFAVGYLSGFSEDKGQIWFSMHHLIVDTVSWRIISDDLRRLYYGSSNLGKKGSSYGEWSRCVQSYGTRKSTTEELYWRNLASSVCCFNDNLNKHNMVSTNGLTKSETCITLNTIQTCSLLRDCPHAYGTNINVLLLTALGYALKELTDSRINYVTLEGHGREDIGDDNININRTVGWFTTMYPILLDIDDDLMRSIMNIKAHLMQVPNKGIGYGTIIGYKDQDLPRVSFNYLGQFETAPSTRRWHLTDGIVGNEHMDEDFNGDILAVNGLCMKGQMRFNITSRLNSDRTTQLANSFKSKLENIIEDCFTTKSLIEIDYSNDFEHPFVLLNANANTILFVLPPGNGGAESYFNNIVPYLSAYKLVLFNNYYHNLKEKELEKGLSFETLARLYIKYIKLIQSNGPYSFLGWSFGGVLSFEISRQLNNAGDRIANIFMIDSYFNTHKASFEIGIMHEPDIIGEINHSYLPQIENEAFGLNTTNMNINIVLFKAKKMNKDEWLRDQLELSQYYVNSTFNCLDTLMNHKCIRVIEMHNESHLSWVSNKEQIVNMCNYLTSVLK